jgi:hypothetical protein
MTIAVRVRAPFVICADNPPRNRHSISSLAAEILRLRGGVKPGHFRSCGGPIALLRDGDIIEIDAISGTVNHQIGDAELENRRNQFRVWHVMEICADGRPGRQRSGYPWRRFE